MIPEAVRSALKSRELPTPRADRAVTAGDIRRAASQGEERLVLVLKVDPERETAQVTLIHPYAEYATTDDLVLAASLTGLTYPVIVQGDLRGAVWLRDLDRLLAQVPEDIVRFCLSSRPVAPATPGIGTGPRMTGPLDARWEFKAAERESILRLCAECTEASLDGTTIALALDDVFTALLEPSPDASRMIEALFNLWSARGDSIVFTIDHVDFLESRGLLSVERWGMALGPDGIAFRMGPMQLLIERALARYGLEEAEPDIIVSVRTLVAA